jgi:predicted nucleotide-binding protein
MAQPSDELSVGTDEARTCASRDTRLVFVVHGRDLRLRDAMFEFLSALDLRPQEWSELVSEAGGSPHIGDVLQTGFSQAQAFLVLMTPDDEARAREPFRQPTDPMDLTPQARPNVIFEAGMALAIDRNRAILVQIGALRPFSDVSGRYVMMMDDSPEKRNELAQRLQAAGCPVNMKGSRWLKSGTFSMPDATKILAVSAPAMPGRPENREVLQELIFDYPEAPTQRGWGLIECDAANQPDFRRILDGYYGDVMEILPRQHYGMDYQVDGYGRMGKQLEFVADFTSSAVLYACVAVHSADESKKREVWLAFVPGPGPARPHEDGVVEWTVFVAPYTNRGDWQTYVVDLAEATERTFGQRGWVYAGLRRFRLRGSLRIARITILA